MSDLSSLEETSSSSEESVDNISDDENSEQDETSETDLLVSEGGPIIDIEDGDSLNNNIQVKESRPPPSWEGQRLFPPARKSSEPSRAWSFGGFIKDKRGQLLKEETICGLCGIRIRYQNSPSNLLHHLRSTHVKDFLAEPSTHHPKINSFFPAKAGPGVSKYKKDHPKQKLITTKLTEWVVSNNRPMLIVEDKKLKEAFEISDPKLQMPTRKLITKGITEEFKKKKAETINELSQVEFFCCTNDAGSSFGAKSFIDVNVHYISEDFEIKKKILDVMEMKVAKTAENYRAKVNAKLAEFDILEKTFIFTTDNEATMGAAFKDEERNGCFAHIESIASKKALDSQKPLKMMRLKLRKIAKKANKSCKFKYALEKQQKIKGVKPKSLKQEVATRFTATHTMIRSFLNDPNENTELEMNDEKIKDNIDAVNQAMMDAKFKKTEFAKLKIQESDVRKMKELVTVLDILEEGITLIGAEKYCTGSVILPFLSKFIKILDDNDDNSVVVGCFKMKLKEELEERCAVNLNRSVLAKASLMDKRFSQLKFLGQEEKDRVLGEIKTELEELEKVHFSCNTEEKDRSAGEPPKKKKRFLGKGLASSDDETDEAETQNENTEKELKRYLLEKKLKSDGDPLLWWKQHKSLYPNLARLARKYLAVQGTATPSERVMSRLGVVLTKRRLAMKGELFSKIMFLTDCI